MEAIEGRSKWIEARVDRSRWVSQRESKSRGNSVIRRCLTGLRRAGSPRIRNAIPRRGHRPATPLFRAINSRKRHANEFFQFLSKLNSLSQSLLFLFPFLRSRDYNLPIPNNFLSFQSCETLAILFHIRRKNSIGIETLRYDSEWKNLREKEKVGGLRRSREMSGGIVIFIARKYIRFVSQRTMEFPPRYIFLEKEKEKKENRVAEPLLTALDISIGRVGQSWNSLS